MSNEVIVSAVGANRPGVLAEVTGAIAELKGNVMDISQKMLDDYFHLLMIVALRDTESEFGAFKDALETLGQDKGYRLSVQHSRVFEAVHRI